MSQQQFNDKRFKSSTAGVSREEKGKHCDDMALQWHLNKVQAHEAQSPFKD
ncbi:3158_t:CDS:2 [Dentiscutata heterogama]|uniref:3158_t:CDS:1 n=1 Tax=Dentiscutata heterogama TaxID=1316150 RepID=A0ACA9K9Q7_9GLOM|nr:3158_t:CDS:2 [Dentiscutata heterogama]